MTPIGEAAFAGRPPQETILLNIQPSESRVQGFRAFTLDNRIVSVTVVPELGGKIVSIRDLRNGREWLWTNPDLPYKRLPYGTSYVAEADTGGWDECFPTVAACEYPFEPWQGTPIPDHGELWPQKWSSRLSGDASKELVISTGASGVAFPYLFQRQLHLHRGGDTLRFDYQVTNLSTDEIAFIWSAHPLFAIAPGMRVRLPEGTELNVYMNVPPAEMIGQPPLNWPTSVKAGGTLFDLARLPDASAGIAFKLWSNPLPAGWAVIEADDGAFRFTFDPSLVPQVGLWLNAGGWSGTGGKPFYNLALEPCIGAQDSLEEAVTFHQQYATLPPHGSRTWWLEVTLSATQRDES